MKAKKKAETAEQTVMNGVITEADIVREWYQKLGKKGGSVKSPAQTASRRRVMAKINERKRARMVGE